MKFSRLTMAAVVVSLVRMIGHASTQGLIRNLYDPVSGLWRAQETPIWYQNAVLVDIGTAVIFVAGYLMIQKGLGKVTERSKKGFKYGIFMSVFANIPFLLFLHAFMPIPAMLVMAWFVIELVLNVISGMLAANIAR